LENGKYSSEEEEIFIESEGRDELEIKNIFNKILRNHHLQEIQKFICL